MCPTVPLASEGTYDTDVYHMAVWSQAFLNTEVLLRVEIVSFISVSPV